MSIHGHEFDRGEMDGTQTVLHLIGQHGYAVENLAGLRDTSVRIEHDNLHKPKAPFDWEAFGKAYAEYHKEYAKHQRTGQMIFNVAYAIDHVRVDQVRGTRIDPFYDDLVIGEFFEFLGKEN